MLNTFKNMSRKSDKFGNVHFISFLGSVLSRMSYLDDNNFLNAYLNVMGNIIPNYILNKIGTYHENIKDYLDDQTLFDLNSNGIQTYDFNGKKYIDFNDMAKQINPIINIKINQTVKEPINPSQNIKYISLGWSNYGEIYIVADKNMPNMIFLIFRGTYSSKTASLYSKPTSIVPLKVCENGGDEFLYGIYKVTAEMIHTIIESINHLATTFLNDNTDKIRIFTTGHSLGGAMATNFSYMWMNVKQTSPYNSSLYDRLDEKIICMSLGSPRAINGKTAETYCKYVEKGKILYLRITTRGDPVPAMPPKSVVPFAGKKLNIQYQHPCSENEMMRQEISEDCNSLLTTDTSQIMSNIKSLKADSVSSVKYDGNLDCQNYKTRVYAPNMMSHMIYLNVLYTAALNITKFLKGMVIQQEVKRNSNGDTICRIIMCEFVNNVKSYKVVFFNVNDSRENATNVDNLIENSLNEETSVSQQQGGGIFDSFFSLFLNDKNDDTTYKKIDGTNLETTPSVNLDDETNDPIPKENVPSTKENVLSTKENVSSIEEPMPSIEENTSSTKENVPSTKENVSSTKENVLSTKENVSSIEETVPSTNENVTMDGKYNLNKKMFEKMGQKIGQKISKITKIGGVIAEDIRITNNVFQKIIGEMTDIVEGSDKCPKEGNIIDKNIFMINNNEPLVKLSCINLSSNSSMVGGKIRKRMSKNKKLMKKRKTLKKNKKRKTIKRKNNNRKRKTIKN